MTRGIVVFGLALFFALSGKARAIPVFAHRYGLSCQVCHATIPHLTPFGQAFLRAGFRLPPNVPAHGAFPVSVKVNVQYSSAPEPRTLPKVIVDELEFLSFASLAQHFSYRIEQYAIDGGAPGLTRDAWLSYSSRPDFGATAATLQATAGQFTLPLPIDPETQRPTLNHYAIFDQTVGANPFNLFDDRIGLDGAFGKQVRGVDLHVLVLAGHDPRSGLPRAGTDTMFAAHGTTPEATFSAYRYDGRRPLGPVSDRFWRQALAASVYRGKAEVDALAQTGRDSSADGFGRVVNSRGGYAQVMWSFSPALTSITRYDTTYDALAGKTESVTASLVVRVRPNMRFTVEGVARNPGGAVNAAWLVAY
jgi:hypothetical protein